MILAGTKDSRSHVGFPRFGTCGLDTFALRHLAYLAALVILALPGSSELIAQAKGSVVGRVLAARDSSPLGGVFVTAIGTGVSTTTALDGRYVLQPIPQGTLTIRFQSVGFSSEERSVRVGADGSVILDIVLKTESMSLEAIVIQGVPARVEQLQSQYQVLSNAAIEPGLQIETIDNLMRPRVEERSQIWRRDTLTSADWVSIGRLNTEIDSLRLQRSTLRIRNALVNTELVGLYDQALILAGVAASTRLPAPGLVQLLNETETSLRDVRSREVDHFLGHVTGWRTVAGNVSGLSGITRAIVILPDNRGERFVRTIGTILRVGGLLASVGGSITALNDPKAGGATIGLAGLSLAASEFARNAPKSVRVFVENVGRNVAFTDEIVLLDSISRPFNEIARILFDSVRPQVEKPEEWLPSAENLAAYYSLILGQRELMGVMRQVLAKSQQLLQLGPTTDGRRALSAVIRRIQDSIDSWQDTEPVYLATYDAIVRLRRSAASPGSPH